MIHDHNKVEDPVNAPEGGTFSVPDQEHVDLSAFAYTLIDAVGKDQLDFVHNVLRGTSLTELFPGATRINLELRNNETSTEIFYGDNKKVMIDFVPTGKIWTAFAYFEADTEEIEFTVPRNSILTKITSKDI